jgi:hypothetical protein
MVDQNSDHKKAGLRRLFCICKEITWQRWRQMQQQPGPKQRREPKQQR